MKSVKKDVADAECTFHAFCVVLITALNLHKGAFSLLHEV